ncbi:MAG: serine hydrolase domain-containing protein [Bacteroidales bacterium]|jgi:CubicO group peptidase (beta-lactamase class C family)|nr:serine hydrolase domain-containing protein [Bacteroidales bacterium]
MDYRYLKIFAFLSIFFVVAVITASIRLDLFGAIVQKEEVINLSTRDKIDKIFYDEKAAILDSMIRQKVERFHFNGSILVGYKGNCIYNQSFGYADIRKREPLAEDAVFQLASVSKQFTAMAVMVLKDRNKLHYDDSVIKYIPDFPYPDITIRMLLNHTSGLANYMWLVEHHWKGDKPPYNDDIMRMIAKHKLPLYFTPGRRFNYSNTGYVVLAAIVENISGERFAEFMNRNIFDPLKMDHSFVYSSSFDTDHQDFLSGFYYRSRRYRMIPPTVNDGAVGDKGVYSTTEDLYKWDQALYTSKLVSEETLNEALTPFKLYNKYTMPYGFGFRIRERNNKKVVYHHGRWNGFRTSLFRFVEDKNTIIVLNHTSSSLNNSIVRDIQQVLDDSVSADYTHDMVTTILDEGLEQAYHKYRALKQRHNFSLDTVKITIASQILTDLHNYESAEKLHLFKKMYKSGQLDHSSIVDNRVGDETATGWSAGKDRENNVTLNR